MRIYSTLFSPQPFEVKEFAVDNSKKYNIERIYVDGSGFLASVDEVSPFPGDDTLI